MYIPTHLHIARKNHMFYSLSLTQFPKGKALVKQHPAKSDGLCIAGGIVLA